ncbi:MAG: hemolysin family protein [Acidimicrobiales bacterium]|jgi:CBS domain containing-hemolysin-like protein
MRRPRLKRTPEAAHGAPSEQELQITSGLKALRESTAREVMTPRVDVVGLATPVNLADVARAVRRSGHSHYPVYTDDVDHLLGVLFVKDLFNLDVPFASGEIEGAKAAFSSADVAARLREPYVVPESRSALEILADMRRGRRGFAVVVDEYGGFAGVITVNDLVSELVGDLRDEFDRTASPAILRIDARRFLVDGACAVDEVAGELGVALPEGDYVTLGGFLFDALGHIPAESETYELDGWIFHVTRMERRRIAKVVVEAPSATIAPGDGAGRTSNGK